MSVIAHSIPPVCGTAREKLLAVPRPIAGIRWPVDGMAFMLCKLTTTQSKTYLAGSPKAPVEAYIKEGIECGRHSLPHRGLKTAEWRRF